MNNAKDLLDRIRSMQEAQESAVLPLKKGADEIRLYFDQGLLNAASSNIPGFRLVEIISRRGLLPDARLAKLWEASVRRKTVLGEIIAAQGALDEVQVKAAIHEQIVQLVIHGARHAFEAGPPGAPERSFQIPAQIGAKMLELEIARLLQLPFKIKSDALICIANTEVIPDYLWYPEELQVINELKQPRNVADLAVATGIDFKRLLKILSVLNSLEFIAVAPRFSSDSTAIIKRSGFPFENLTPQIDVSSLNEKLKAFSEAPSFASEQFESLKIRVREIAGARTLRVITVSSPNIEEGKSFVSANLAASFAKDPERRTILIDCDLRNPTLHKLIGTNLEPGLLGYLESDLPPYCYMRRCGNLYIMTAGGFAANPIEMLSTQKLQNLIAHFRTEFDTVLLDSPSLSPTSDVQILTSLSDGLIMVVRSGQTSFRSLRRTFRHLATDKLLGIVLNDMKPILFNTQYNPKYYGYQSDQQFPFIPKSTVPRKTYLE